LVLLIAVAVVARSVDAQSPPIRLRIGLVVPANATQSTLSVARGVRLGAAESKQTTALFGGDVELFEAPGTGAAGVNAAANLLLARRKVQILIAAAAEDVETLSQFAELHKLLSMNAASRHASLRSACQRNTFHVETPDIAYLNAKALARLAGTTASTNRMTGVAEKPDSVALWSASLERFGASQLNARYRGMFGADMDGGAWAGWFAIKTVAEAALRARSTDPAKMLLYLEAPSTQFDGHKGWPLIFRRADHQLRQPLYIVATPSTSTRTDKSSVQDVPDIRQFSGGTQDPATLLDRLLARPGTRACSWLPL
jgi:hypothetical protein